MIKFSPTYDEFLRGFEQGQAQIVYCRVISDIDTPVSAFIKLSENSIYPFLLESVTGGEQRGRYSVIGMNPDLVFKVEDEKCFIGKNNKNFTRIKTKPLNALQELLQASKIEIPDNLPPMAAGLFGYIGYDMVRHIEKLPNINKDPIGTPDILLVRPKLVAIFDQIAQEIILCTNIYPDKNNAETEYKNAINRLQKSVKALEKPNISLDYQNISAEQNTEPEGGVKLEDYAKKVKSAHDYIKAGDIFQVVISQRFETDYTLPPFSLYRALRRLNPSPFLYYFDFADFQIIGSSPEILVRLRNDIITIRPIAGTRPRGKTLDEDKALERELLADEKEMAEHLMLIDLARNDIGKLAKTGSVKLTEQAIIERYSHVMHIVSNVQGEKLNDKTALDCLMAGFPHGTVSGAPKVRAMEIIDELEDEKRGIYAGAVGYFSAGGDMDTAIALRTAIIKDGKMHVRAGGGLVLDSDAKSEWQECRNKAKALFVAQKHASYFNES